MREKFVAKSSFVALVLLLAAVGAASPTVAVAAAPADGEYRASEWAEPAEFASSGSAPNLTGDATKADTGTSSSLAVGFALSGLGLLGLALGVTRLRTGPRVLLGPTAPSSRAP
jgi:hypothetical protein